MSTTETSSSTTAREARVVCLTASRARGSSGRSLIQQSSASSSRATIGGPLGVGEHVAAADVDVVLEPDRHRLRRDRRLERPVEGLDRRDARAAARRQHDDLVAGPPDAAGDLARRSRGSRGARRTSAGSPTAPGSGGRRGSGRRRPRSSRGARAASGPRTRASPSPRSTTLSPRSADIGIARASCRPSRSASACEVGLDLGEALGREVDEIHLVHRDDDVRDRRAIAAM